MSFSVALEDEGVDDHTTEPPLPGNVPPRPPPPAELAATRPKGGVPPQYVLCQDPATGCDMLRMTAVFHGYGRPLPSGAGGNVSVAVGMPTAPAQGRDPPFRSSINSVLDACTIPLPDTVLALLLDFLDTPGRTTFRCVCYRWASVALARRSTALVGITAAEGPVGQAPVIAFPPPKLVASVLPTAWTLKGPIFKTFRQPMTSAPPPSATTIRGVPMGEELWGSFMGSRPLVSEPATTAAAPSPAP
eukprot:EG_transcript_24905